MKTQAWLPAFCFLWIPFLFSAHPIDSLIDRSIVLQENSGDYGHALELARSALSLAQKDDQKYRSQQGRCQVEIGRCLRALGQYDEALGAYEKALQIRKELFDSAGVASVYNNMSSAYLGMYNFEDAEACSQKAIALYRQIPGSENQLLRACNNWANVLGEKGDRLEEAIAMNRLAIDLIQRIPEKDTLSWIDAEYGFGKRLIQKGDYAAARHHLQQALALGIQLDDGTAIGQAQEGLGVVALHENDLEAAREYFEQAKAMYQQAGDSLALAYVYFNLGELHGSAAQFADARQAYHHARINLNKNVVPGENLGDVIDQRILYNEASRNQFKFRNVLSATIILALLIAIILLTRLVKERAAKMLEKEQKLRLQEEALHTREELLNVKEKLRRIRHSVIKDSVHTMLPYIESNLQESATGAIPQEQFLRFKRMINRLLRKINEPLENMGRPITLKAFAAEMHECAEDAAMMTVRHFSSLDDAGGYPLSNAVAHHMEIIVNLAFSNIRNHAGCRQATIAFEVEGNYLVLDIEDDGKGFDPQHVRKGAEGLVDINDHTREMNGTCRIISSPGQGTQIQIKVPSFLASSEAQANS
ncbi:MAG: tetratricopeptide repeat protein [Saprospiraceae bacterium]|nr:tetratricopeptide repeat protein [Saprospiraceae bacterium]